MYRYIYWGTGCTGPPQNVLAPPSTFQEETMSKTGRWSAVRCSAVQSQSTRQGQVGQQISRPEPGSTGQSRPERASEDHTSTHLSAADRTWLVVQALVQCTFSVIPLVLGDMTFPMAPPDWILTPTPLYHLIKKILESPLHQLDWIERE